MVLGDLNSNLDVPRNEQEAEIAATMDSIGLACATKHFRVRAHRRRILRGRWSWRRRRAEGRGERGRGWYKTKPDYFLLPSRERRKVTRCRFVMLPGHSTDHRALVALLHTGEKGNITAYRKKLQQCPLRIPRGRMSSDEKKFETLRRAVEPQQARDRPENSWIRPGTWALIDSRAAARRDGHLSRALSRRYGRKIRASLKLDRIEQARRVGEAISGHLATGDYKEAWRSLRGWYRTCLLYTSDAADE